MSVKYKNGKIYKLFSHDNDLIYIGSTTQQLSKRLADHKNKSKTCSKILFENSNDVKIELLENCECDNVEQLHRLEGEYIRRLDCVNKRIAGRTRKEYYDENKEQMKEYRENNKEKIKEQKKEYYENNKEQIKEYYEKSKEKRKEYLEKNKEQIKERSRS